MMADNLVKVGIAGLGRSGWGIHARILRTVPDLFKIVAVFDADPKRLEEANKDFGCKTYSDFKSLIADKDVELTVVAMPSHLHAPCSIEALQAGKAVVCEKPMATNTADADKMIAAARKAGKFFTIFQNYRYNAHYMKLKEVIESGKLGRIVEIKISVHGFGRRWDWQTLQEFGGGSLNNTGPHFMDMALQLMGDKDPKVFCHLERAQTLGDADDHVKIMLVGENGVVADIEISNAVALPDAYCTVYGNRGSLICADEKTIQLKYIDPAHKLPERRVTPGLPPPDGGMGRDEDFHWIQKTVKVEPEGDMWELVEFEIARHLYRAIRENVPFPVVNADALEVVRITEAVKKQNPQFQWL
jgi:scyllo-inositol 2-dehydrogenase (NADP+)